MQNAADALGDLWVIAPQQALATLDESDAAAEVVKQLAKLEADVARPDHDQMLGQGLQIQQRGARQRVDAV